jgi:putative proteasome-type protease
MTFCLGMRLKDGLIGIADTRITMGTECTTARKVSIYQKDRYSFFLMTSGLRSVRDKALTYFDEYIEENDAEIDRLFKVVNAFGAQVRRVAREDKEALAEGGLPFNIYSLIGGQLENDQEHKLYLLYPQGNWVEISEGTPYHIIGESGYGKPILDRTLKFGDSMQFGFKVGCLAFDSTRISAADVDFPLDVVLYLRDSFQIIEHRYEKADLLEVSNWWQDRLRQSISELPAAWVNDAFSKLAPPSADIRILAGKVE